MKTLLMVTILSAICAVLFMDKLDLNNQKVIMIVLIAIVITVMMKDKQCSKSNYDDNYIEKSNIMPISSPMASNDLQLETVSNKQHMIIPDNNNQDKPIDTNSEKVIKPITEEEIEGIKNDNGQWKTIDMISNIIATNENDYNNHYKL